VQGTGDGASADERTPSDDRKHDARNPALLAELPDLNVDTSTIVEDLDAGRDTR
jgi:hypothetical protein